MGSGFSAGADRAHNQTEGDGEELRVMSLARMMRSRGPSAVVIQPYSGAGKIPNATLLRWATSAGILAYCVISGFYFALFAPFVIVPFFVPVAVLGALAIWALPDARKSPTRSLEIFYWVFFAALFTWPNYLAIALSGLPWITMIRLTGFPMVFLLLICASTSSDFRSQIGNALKETPLLWKFLLAFLVIQAVSIAFSSSPAVSVQKFIVAQLTWTTAFFVSCYLFLKPGRVQKWALLFWIVSVVVCVVGLWEFKVQKVPWAGHIPPFLKIEDEYVQKILAGATRDNRYRVQSTFSTSLSYAEFLALALPFALHFAVQPYRPALRIAAALTIPVSLFLVLESGSRLGLIGFILGPTLYLAFWGVLQWRRDRGSLLGPTIVLAYPAIFCAVIASTFFVGRIRMKVWGNGTQAASTQGRIDQYNEGIPKVLGHPWGYGIGMATDALGVTNQAGVATIDTYYLLVALDYGILGFIAYYGMILCAIYTSGKYAFLTVGRHRDYAVFIPMAISLSTFFVIKSVFSQEGNHPLVFMMLGAITALTYRVHKEEGKLIAKT